MLHTTIGSKYKTKKNFHGVDGRKRARSLFIEHAFTNIVGLLFVHGDRVIIHCDIIQYNIYHNNIICCPVQVHIPFKHNLILHCIYRLPYIIIIIIIVPFS